MELETAMNLFMHGAFFLLLLMFTVYSLFLGYHWFTYGTARKAAMTALTIYLSVAGVLFLIMGSLLL